MNDKKISRRNIISTACVSGVAAMAFNNSAAEAKETPEKTAFALIGDRYHNSDYIRTALTKTLVEGSGITIDFTDEITKLNQKTLGKYRLLIIFRDGMIWPGGYRGSYPGYVPENGPEIVSEPPLTEIKEEPAMWITSEQGKAVREFIQNGGSALFYHNSSHISLGNADYRHAEGAIYTGHPPVRAFHLRVTDKKHPITQGVNDFLVVDEQHYVKYEKDPSCVFLRSENAEGLDFDGQGPSCEAGWAYDYGKGRVCFLGPGHMISAVWNPEYMKLQKNAVNWLLKNS